VVSHNAFRCYWWVAKLKIIISVLDRQERCLEDKLKTFIPKSNSRDAFIYRNFKTEGAEKPDKYFLPYIGMYRWRYRSIAWTLGSRSKDPEKMCSSYNP